jgi:hypothetical protein
MRENTNNVATKLSILLLAFFIGLIGTGLVMALYPYEPLRLDKFLTDRTEAAPGDKICFQFVGEKFYAVPVYASVELVNGEAIAIMSYTANAPAGEPFKKRCFVVPSCTESTYYKIRWTGTWPMNILNNVRRVYYSGWIKVEEKGKVK